MSEWDYSSDKTYKTLWVYLLYYIKAIGMYITMQL